MESRSFENNYHQPEFGFTSKACFSFFDLQMGSKLIIPPSSLRTSQYISEIVITNKELPLLLVYWQF